MSDRDDHDDDEPIDATAAHSAPAPDRFGDALALCKLANNKVVATQLKKLRRVNRQITDAEAKVIAVQDQAEQMKAAFDARAAACDERERALEAREAEFEASLAEARDHLRAYYDSLADTDRRLRYRILNHAGLLGGYNPQLQDLPTWDQLKRLVVGLPDDLPAASPAEVVSENVREDWTGSIFTPGSSLTRTVRGASGEQRS